MKYRSTRNNSKEINFSEAILKGLAEDGGLYVPITFPNNEIEKTNLPFYKFAAQILKPFFKTDPLESEIESICENAFNFEIPLKKLNETTHVLELFHGPTLAFKDVGARFLSECLNRIPTKKQQTILVATSGDTGSAVASAFHGKENINVIVLYPKGKISERQEKQIVCWNKNILPLSVNGTFDDCQRLVKSAFECKWWKENTSLTTANSINIGRLLPQMAYYAYSSVIFFNETSKNATFIIPSGNIGNATACFWAKKMGFPIENIHVTTNANNTIPQYLADGEIKSYNTIPTLANAMDVSKPSNLERLIDLFPNLNEFRSHIRSVSVNDESIQEIIQNVFINEHYICCPHTATAFAMNNSSESSIIVSTAHPCKFEQVVEPIIGQDIKIHENLKSMLQTVNVAQNIDAKLERIQEAYKKTLL